MTEVANYVEWAHKHTRRSISPSHKMYDDVVQEALIAIWKAEAKIKAGSTQNATFLTNAAKWRTQNVFEREHWTGMETEKFKPRDPARRFESMVSYDAWDEDQRDSVLFTHEDDEVPESDMSILSDLTERERDYVYRRFWMTQSDKDIALDWGVSHSLPHNTWQRAMRKLRPVLEARM